MTSTPEESQPISKRNAYFTCMSKRRYKDISDGMKEIINDEEKWGQCMELIRQIMNFDINSNTSDPIRSEKVREARLKKAQEMNTSTYKAFKLDEYHKKTYGQKKNKI